MMRLHVRLPRFPFAAQSLCVLTLLLSPPGWSQDAVTLKAQGDRFWVKGNTHTHTLWSDGDAAPEIAVAWYKEHDYRFLCLSDHNILSDGSVEKWQPIGSDGTLPSEKVAEIEQKFGQEWCRIAIRDGSQYMKLKTLPEIRDRFEEPGRFLLIQAEEITSYFPSVHMNVLNNRRVIPPVNSKAAHESITSAIESTNRQSDELGIPMLVHLNHPNWDEGVGAQDIIESPSLRFFEVYNGHPDVRNWGSQEKGMVSTDRIWDTVLSHRLRHGQAPLLGVASDDTHDYYERRVGLANSGRGWVQVLVSELAPDAIVEAMKRGHFYASSGVDLEEIAASREQISVSIAAEEGVSYQTQFIGTLKPSSNGERPRDYGAILKETDENPAVYSPQGHELYVRAKVISSKLQDNPFAEGDYETAWTQPFVPTAK